MTDQNVQALLVFIHSQYCCFAYCFARSCSGVDQHASSFWIVSQSPLGGEQATIPHLKEGSLSFHVRTKQEGMFLLTCIDSFLQITLMVWKLYIKSMRHFENWNIVFYAIYRWRACGKDNDSTEYHLPEKLASIHWNKKTEEKCLQIFVLNFLNLWRGAYLSWKIEAHISL